MVWPQALSLEMSALGQKRTVHRLGMNKPQYRHGALVLTTTKPLRGIQFHRPRLGCGSQSGGTILLDRVSYGQAKAVRPVAVS